MALDVDVPEPPDLTNRGTPSDYPHSDELGGSEDFRREELEAMLRDGAWREGFEEWGEYTDLDDEEVRAVADLGLFRDLDFYWDPVDETLRYDAPSVPGDWRERVSESLSSTSQASRVETELDDLGRTVLEELQDTYLDWSDEAEDYVWSEETFGETG
jgi:hypothetical protein